MHFKVFTEGNDRRKSCQKFVVEVCLPLRGDAAVVQTRGDTAGWVMSYRVSSRTWTRHVDSHVLSSE